MLSAADIKQIVIELGNIIERKVTAVLDQTQENVHEVQQELAEVESQMVTRSYLDDKLAELEGSLIARQREDQKS